MSDYLTPEQVHELNEKHGWFEYGDAQSDVSKAFARDAIEKYEAMRTAAPELLKALQGMLGAWNMVCDANGWERDHIQQQVDAVAAIAKATGDVK